MHILGINISHDASSCLMKDGKIIYYIEEERLNHKKYYMFDYNTSHYSGISKLKKYGINKIDRLVFTSYRRKYDVYDQVIIQNIIDQLISSNIQLDQILYNPNEHHLYHAYNGFYSSGLNEAAVLVMDGIGAYNNKHLQHREIDSIYYFNKDSNNIIYRHKSDICYHKSNEVSTEFIREDYDLLLSNSFSTGRLFAEYCKLVGLNGGEDAGKLMGMSSYGKAKSFKSWVDMIDGYPIFNSDCLSQFNSCKQITEFQDQADIAKKVQDETKYYTIQLLKKTIDKTKLNKIVLSGGYFLNCVNNYEYIREFPNVEFYIDPICYDGGTAIGACMMIQKIMNNSANIEPLQNIYLGG